jgi:hypothetical protein
MTSPNTIIADMQAVETNLRQQIAHLNDEIAGLKSDLAYVEKQRDEFLTICKNVVDRGIGASDVKAMKAAIATAQGVFPC